MVIVETVPKSLPFSVFVVTSYFSLGFFPTIAANFSVNDVIFVCETSFIVSGVLLVISSPLPIGVNSIYFVPCSSTICIGINSVVFHSTPSKLCSGVSRSTSVMGILFQLVCFSSVFCHLLFLVLTKLTEIFFLITPGFVGVCFLCVDVGFA